MVVVFSLGCLYLVYGGWPFLVKGNCVYFRALVFSLGWLCLVWVVVFS